MSNKFLIIACILFMCIACESKSAEDIVDPPVVDEEAEDRDITYAADISELIVDRCLNCHDDPVTNNAPFPLNTFDLVTMRNALILNSIQGANGVSLMPPGIGLAANEIALFEEWIEDGLIEN